MELAFSGGDGATPRRQPVYLLLECSMGMRGIHLASFTALMQSLFDLFMSDSLTRNCVAMSVITFGTDATQTPLTRIRDFTPPTLVADGVCRLDGALYLLASSIESDVAANTATTRGDFPPLALLVTGSLPTDENGYPFDLYKPELARLRSLRANQNPHIAAFGIGYDPPEALLRSIADEAILTPQLDVGAVCSLVRRRLMP